MLQSTPSSSLLRRWPARCEQPRNRPWLLAPAAWAPAGDPAASPGEVASVPVGRRTARGPLPLSAPPPAARCGGGPLPAPASPTSPHAGGKHEAGAPCGVGLRPSRHRRIQPSTQLPARATNLATLTEESNLEKNGWWWWWCVCVSECSATSFYLSLCPFLQFYKHGRRRLGRARRW